MVSRADLQAAFVLHHRAFRDTSVIADLLTPNYGRVSVVARGARSAKSRRRALLQPFRPLLASWTGRSELMTLTTLEESGQALTLTGTALAYAYYITELAMRLVPVGQANVELFASYSQTLQALAKPDADVTGLQGESLLRGFELELLDALGLLPDFSSCDVENHEIDVSQSYQFDPHAGQATLGVTATSSVAVSGRALLAMHARDFYIDAVPDATLLLEAKRVMRQLLRVHLGPQPLKSRQVFKQLHTKQSADE